MDRSLFNLFLYATLILTALTLLGTAYFLRDRARRRGESPSHMEMTPAERLADVETQIASLERRLAALKDERAHLLGPDGASPHSPRSM